MEAALSAMRVLNNSANNIELYTPVGPNERAVNESSVVPIPSSQIPFPRDKRKKKTSDCHSRGNCHYKELKENRTHI